MPKPPYPVAAFSAMSGISNALLIAVINAAAETVANNQLNWEYLILYLLGLGAFVYAKRFVLDRSAEIVKSIVSGIRHRLADMVRKTELATLEKYGVSSIYARISQDAAIVSGSSVAIVNGAQSAIMVVFTLFYIAAVSVWSFGLIVAGLVAGSFYYASHTKTFRAMWQKVSQKETEFFEKLGHILQGFNEVRINRRKNEEVFRAYMGVNNDVKSYRIKTGKRYNITLIFLEVFLYLLLGAILFGLPKLHAEYSEAVIKVVAALLFTVGPLEGIIYSVPVLANANNAARNIMELEAQLAEELKRQRELQIEADSPAAYLALPFEQEIELKGLSYQYPQKNSYGPGFRVGPVDLTIQKGELIFVTGGNGSGKSTFLKLFAGLYQQGRGHIRLDSKKGKLVNLDNHQQYQNLFSIIFSDYHLFDKIYGIEREIDPEEVNVLLDNLGLPEGKVAYKNGAFTNTRLSSGQKKRLALATVLLEDKPIYVFDEVAADLDPAFRDKFYYELLPELKARNKTILVVSHDQQYWNVSDRLIHFQDGMMRELSKEEVRSLVRMVVK